MSDLLFTTMFLSAAIWGDAPASGQESTQERRDAASESDAPALLSEPKKELPKLRRIYFYPSNAPKLVPEGFWAVGLDELEGALAQQFSESEPGNESPQLVSAVYVARFESGALICDGDASIFDIAYRRKTPGSLLLGEMNLALLGPSTGSSRTQSPRLVTTAEGRIAAIVERDTRLRFGWSHRGQQGPGETYAYDIQLPPCGRARFVIGLPQGLRLATDDGVLTQLPSPPQEVGNLIRQTAARWYSIEIGGLSRLRLAIEPATPRVEGGRVVTVRKMGVDGSLSASGLDWTARLEMDLSAGQTLPELSIGGGGRLTAARINDEEVRWVETSHGGELLVKFESIPSKGAARQGATTILVSGFIPIRPSPNQRDEVLIQKLPWLQVTGTPRVIANPTNEIQIRLESPLKLATIEPMQRWEILENTIARDTSSQLLRIVGPPDQIPPDIEVLENHGTVEFQQALALSVQEGILRCNTEIILAAGSEGGFTPLPLDLQDGWEIESINVRGAGRAVQWEGNRSPDDGIVYWPEEGDAVDGVITLQVTGVHTLQTNEFPLAIPPTWFIRPRAPIGRTLAAMVLPVDMEWEPLAHPQGRQLRKSDLPPAILPIFEPYPVNTLFFEIGAGSSPALMLRRPAAAFHSETTWDLRRDGDQILETIRIRFQVPAGRPPAVQVRLGITDQRPDVQWSIAESPSGNSGEELGSDRLSLAASRVSNAVDAGQLWELQPAGGIRDGLVILGERRYDSKMWPDQKPQQLPSILASSSSPATTHRGLCQIGPGLSFVEGGANIVRVPPVIPELQARVGEAGEGDQAEPQESWLLRYPANDITTVTVRLSDEVNNNQLIWEERIEILAGRIGDEIHANYLLDGRHPIEIEFEPSMRLMQVEGEILSQKQDIPGVIIVKPQAGQSTIQIAWQRPVSSNSWFRSFLPPKIETKQLAIKRHWNLWGTQDVLLLADGRSASAPPWMASDAGPIMISVTPGNTLYLLAANFATAIACAGSLVIGVLAWFLMIRKPWLALPLIATIAAVALLYPVWTRPLSGFALLPSVVGALLASGQRRLTLTAFLIAAGILSYDEQLSAQSSPVPSPPTSAIAAPQSKTEPLAASPHQEPVAMSSGLATPAPIPVLIPMTPEGTLAGDKVYIPEFFRNQLFAPKPIEADYTSFDLRSADYQIRISPSGMTGEADLVSLEGTWRLEVLSTERPIFLPLENQIVDRLELIIDGVPNEIRPLAQGNGIAIRMPRTGLFTLRAQLSPPVEATFAGSSRLLMRIPPSATSSLTVVSDAPFEQINLPNCLGQIEKSDAGNRLSAALGAIDTLEVIWQRRGLAIQESLTSLSRRWLLQFDSQQLSRELELEVGQGLRAGVVVDLMINSDQVPILTTTGWKMSRSDSAEGLSNRYQLVATMDSPGPIRLLWISPTSDTTGVTGELPDIRPVSQNGTIETWVGVHLADRWDLVFGGRGGEQLSDEEGGAQVLEPGEFSRQWRGFPTPVVAARRFRVAGPLSYRATRSSQQTWSAVETHQVTLSAEIAHLRYRLTIQPGRSAPPAALIRLPAAMQIEQFRMDSAAVTPNISSLGNEGLLPLPTLSINRPLECELTGTISLDKDGRFRPPRLFVEGIPVVSSDYVLQRYEGIRLRELIEPPDVQAASIPAEYDLTRGIIPLRSWRLSTGIPAKETSVGGEYQIVSVKESFDASTLTTLQWNSGVWSMDVVVDVGTMTTPADFLTLEIPRRWTQGLDVQPAAKWSIQPTSDSARFLLRILPANTSAGRLLGGTPFSPEKLTERIRIRSTLDSAAEGSISIPEIRVLAEGERKKYLATPRRLTSKAISWLTQNLRAAELPASFLDAGTSPETHQVYEVLGDSFQAVLEPSSIGNEVAQASLMEISLFQAEEDTILAIQRLHLLPGDRAEIAFSIPESTTVRSVWSAGLPLPAQFSEGTSLLRLPLAISRLGHEVILVSQLERNPTNQIQWPKPIDINVQATWLVSFLENPSPLSLLSTSSQQQPWKEQTREEFRDAVARSVMTTLENSLESVAERSLPEKQRWLGCWFARLSQLGFSPPAEPQDADSGAAIELADPSLEPGSAWDALERFVPRILLRVLGTEPALTPLTSSEPLFGMLNPQTWEPQTIAMAPGTATTCSLAVNSQERLSFGTLRHHGLSLGIILAVSLLSSLVAFAVGPAKLEPPSLWLLALGIALLPFAPLPLAIALMVVSVIAPWLPRTSAPQL